MNRLNWTWLNWLHWIDWIQMSELNWLHWTDWTHWIKFSVELNWLILSWLNWSDWIEMIELIELTESIALMESTERTELTELTEFPELIELHDLFYLNWMNWLGMMDAFWWSPSSKCFIIPDWVLIARIHYQYPALPVPCPMSRTFQNVPKMSKNIKQPTTWWTILPLQSNRTPGWQAWIQNPNLLYKNYSASTNT